jgi:histone deacetylase 1/2
VVCLIIIRHDVLVNLRELPFAPSVALQEVPRQSVSDIISQQEEEEDENAGESDIDKRIRSISSLSLSSIIPHCSTEVISHIYNDRMEAESVFDSELEDAAMFEESPTSSLDGTQRHSHQRTSVNPFGHDRHPTARTKRQFFRSSLVWDPLQTDLRTKIASMHESAMEGVQSD